VSISYFFILAYKHREMSLASIGADTRYVLPASYDAVPQAFQSNKSAKSIPSVLQTVNVPALTTSANASGTSIVQLPCGQSAGIMLNPYLRFDLALVGGDNTTTVAFKGQVKAATGCINNYTTYVNSMQIDNIQNADRVYEQIFCHATSNDWTSRDATVLMSAGISRTAAAANQSLGTQCVPLLGLLGSQQGIPLYLFNGTLQINITWNSLARALQLGGTLPTDYAISNVQLIYDRIAVEQAFVDKVKSDMMSGAKYVLAYTNMQNTTLAISGASAQPNFQYGLNVSSLRAVVADQCLALTTQNNAGLSVINDLSQFQLSLDGRLINNNVLSLATYPVVFAELNKAYGRLFDASITDVSAVSYSTSTETNSFKSGAFAVAVSCTRCNEALAFAGSPVSVCGIQAGVGGSGAASTFFITFISDFQLLVDASGQCEIVR
jgi:hypothetical protein